MRRRSGKSSCKSSGKSSCKSSWKSCGDSVDGARPNIRTRITLTAILAAQFALPTALADDGLLVEDDALFTLSDQTLADYTTGWYRTEVLIFIRDESATFDEDWDPLPTLQYPDAYQHLINPALAEQRLSGAGAFVSAITASGIQQLTVPRPAELLDGVPRPDIDPTPELPPDPNAPVALLEAEPDALPLEPNSIQVELDPNQPAEAPLPRAIVALPYRLLPQDQLTFSPQARTLRRGGSDIVFHGGWWSPIAEESAAIPIVLDRSGDVDVDVWPRLQGSIKLHRSRFLHADINLWINTEGDYLPEGWQIDPPPLAPPSLEVFSIGGESINPWQEETTTDIATPDRPNDPTLTPGLSAIDISDGNASYEAGYDASEKASENNHDDPTGRTDEVGDESSADDEQLELQDAESTAFQEPRIPYSWRHAIVHTQSRRMRSGEIHYLDHPLIGVIIRVSPIDEETLPLAADDEQEFRVQHGIPSVSAVLEPEEEL